MEWIAFAASVLTALLSFLGVYISNRKTAAVMEWRLKELEKKVDKHNQVVERTFKLEQKVEDLEKKGA
jgi:hypothetical protein